MKEGNLSIPQPIQEEAEDVANENSVDPEEQKLRDQLQGVLNACAGSLGLQSAPQEIQIEASEDEKDQAPHRQKAEIGRTHEACRGHSEAVTNGRELPVQQNGTHEAWPVYVSKWAFSNE